MKVRTEIIDSIAASTIGQALKLVIMYVETFKTSATAFIGKVIISLKSHRLLEINGKMSKLLINKHKFSLFKPNFLKHLSRSMSQN